MGDDGTQNGLRVPVDRVAKRGELLAVFNIVDHADLLLKGYDGGELYRVVQGLDRDGDGRIDDVHLVE